jgi:hypothetical protein
MWKGYFAIRLKQAAAETNLLAVFEALVSNPISTHP